MRISDWIDDVCSSDLEQVPVQRPHAPDHERADGHPQAATIERRRRHVDTSAAGATFGARALDSVIATTPSRITAIAPRSCALKRSAASHAPSTTATTGLT